MHFAFPYSARTMLLSSSRGPGQRLQPIYSGGRMSEERFVVIEGRLTSIEIKVDGLGREMHELHADAKREMHELHADAKREMHELHADAKREMHALHDDLAHQMRVLHEDTIANIKALAPDPGEITRQFTAADDQVRADIAARLDPLEAFARTRGFQTDKGR
jgi:hypothetical protein